MTGAGRPFRLCLVGLPKTGKTTFIAALWSYLTAGLQSGGYRVNTFPKDPRYLNTIAQAWSAGSSMPRNSLDSDARITFSVETPSGTLVEVVLPDLPGEEFRNAVTRSIIDDAAAEAVTSSDLILFFVNGESARTLTALGDFPPIEADPESLNIIQDAADSTEEVTRQKPPDFAIERLDSDTLNSELLNKILYLNRDREPVPVLVLVSAWDVFEILQETPASWLDREQPMLSQLIAEHGRSARVGVLGISAQGAKYENNPGIVSLFAYERAWSSDNGTRLSIAQPLVWYDEDDSS